MIPARSLGSSTGLESASCRLRQAFSKVAIFWRSFPFIDQFPFPLDPPPKFRLAGIQVHEIQFFQRRSFLRHFRNEPRPEIPVRARKAECEVVVRPLFVIVASARPEKKDLHGMAPPENLRPSLPQKDQKSRIHGTHGGPNIALLMKKIPDFCCGRTPGGMIRPAR